MSVDNFKQIRTLLRWDDPDLFYYIQVIRRKKENPEAKHAKVIKNIYVHNEEYLNNKEKYIKDLCEHFTARAYIRLNRRSLTRCALLSMQITTDYLLYDQPEAVIGAYSHACGSEHKEPNRIWVIDVDEQDYLDEWEYNNACIGAVKKIEYLQSLTSDGYKVLAEIPTKNGTHIITEPFRKDKFEEVYPKIAIQTDNPTLLYCA